MTLKKSILAAACVFSINMWAHPGGDELGKPVQLPRLKAQCEGYASPSLSPTYDFPLGGLFGDEKRPTARLLGAISAGYQLYVSLMLLLGWDANGRDFVDLTPLYTAAINGRLDALRDLIAHGANVNAVVDRRIAQGAHGYFLGRAGLRTTALIAALRNEQYEAAGILISAGATLPEWAPETARQRLANLRELATLLAKIPLSDGKEGKAPEGTLPPPEAGTKSKGDGPAVLLGACDAEEEAVGLPPIVPAPPQQDELERGDEPESASESGFVMVGDEGVP